MSQTPSHPEIPQFLLIGNTRYMFIAEDNHLDQRPVIVLRSKGYRRAFVSLAVLREMLETGVASELTEGEYNGYTKRKGPLTLRFPTEQHRNQLLILLNCTLRDCQHTEEVVIFNDLFRELSGRDHEATIRLTPV